MTHTHSHRKKSRRRTRQRSYRQQGLIGTCGLFVLSSFFFSLFSPFPFSLLYIYINVLTAGLYTHASFFALYVPGRDWSVRGTGPDQAVPSAAKAPPTIPSFKMGMWREKTHTHTHTTTTAKREREKSSIRGTRRRNKQN